MTLYVPLSGTRTPPASPSTLKKPSDNSRQIERAAKAIAKAKRIVVVSGAGVSVRAGIPDFRSADGLFQQLKREHPKEGLSTGRELFDASVFHSESTATMFYKMIARLSRAVERAQPTPFHQMLKALDERNQLLRCYTQNIDCIEEKAGLSLGVPSPQTPRKSPKKQKRSPSNPHTDEARSHSSSPSPSPVATPPVSIDATPKCIPLHGTLKTLYCRTCNATTSLAANVSSFENGSVPACLQCSEFEHTRQLVGKRLRGVGVMRPSIVLYNEDHREGERVGDIVKRDLTGGRTKRAPPDLLLVAGTSLRVPGTKRIVKEFSKAARSGVVGNESCSSTPTGTPGRRSPNSTVETDERPIRTIYLNLDFPMPAREWESTFDVWIQGDIQEFVGKVRQAMEEQDGVKKAKEDRIASRTSGEKRKRDPELQEEGGSLNSAMASSSLSGKRRRVIAPPVIDKATTDPPPLRAHAARPQVPGSMDVFGPVLPALPGGGLRGHGPGPAPTLPGSVSCSVQRRTAIGYHTYPLPSLTTQPPSGLRDHDTYGHGTAKTDVVHRSDTSVALQR